MRSSASRQHRLVVQLEFADRQRLAQFDRQPVAALGVEAHGGFVKAEGGAAVSLGGIKGKVGIAQQRVDVVAIPGRKCDADAAIDMFHDTVELERRREGLHDALGEGSGIGLVLIAQHEDQCELVAAEPCDHVRRAHQQLQPVGDFDQKRIARRMAHAVVDVLEVVDVDIHQRERTVREPDGQQIRDVVGEEAAIRKAGQCIVHRYVGDTLFIAAPFGDVLRDADEIAGSRPVHRRDGALHGADGAEAAVRALDILLEGENASCIHRALVLTVE